MNAEAPTVHPARRWVPILLVVAALFVAVRVAGGDEGLSPGRAAQLIREAGPWGLAVYVGAFVLGEIALVPGAILIVAAPLVYGPIGGTALAYVGSMVASTASFTFARRMGVRAPSVAMPRLVERGLGHLERRPVATVGWLRFVFAAYPGLSLALAATSIRRRDYVVGTAIGLVVPVTLLTTLSTTLASRLGG